MTFFYDLNKKLDGIRAKPETTHQQLNERDEGKPGKNFEKIAKDAGERYGSEAAGKRVAGAVRNKLRDQGKLEEEGFPRIQAAREKYGDDGLEALRKKKAAGASKKTMQATRKQYDKYDESIEDRIGDLDMTNPVNQPAYQRKAAAQGGAAPATKSIIGKRREGYPRFSGGEREVAPMPKSLRGGPRFSGGGGYTGKGVKEEDSAAMTPKQKSFAKLAPPADKITFADKIAGAKKEVDEMLGDVAAEAMKGALRGGQKKLDKNDNGRLDANDFAMLRAGKDKSKEMEEGIVDWAKEKYHDYQTVRQWNKFGKAQAKGDTAGMQAAQDAAAAHRDQLQATRLKRTGSTLAKNSDYGMDRDRANIAALQKKGLVPQNYGRVAEGELAEGWDDMLKAADERRRDSMRTGEKTQGHKGEIERTATGIRHTRRYDPKTGETDAGDDASTSGEKRGRGRPKGSKASIGAKGPSGKSKLMTRESSQQELDEAIAKLEAAGYTVEKAPPGAKAERMVKHIKAGYADDGKITDRERGIAYATAWKAKKAGKVEEESDEQRDEKAEKAGRRVAQDIEYDEKVKDKIHGKKRGSEDDTAEKAGKKVTKDIEYDEKKKKVKEQGGAETPTASSGFSFGKGIYDSINHELETMIAESMNISMNMNTDANGGPSRSLTVTATDDDAMKLGQLLKNAGLGGDHDMGNNGAAEVEIHGAEDIADRIRQALGGDHEEVDEAYGDTAVDENNPDFPTNTEYNSDSLQYSGGLNKPKTDVAGDGQTTIPNTAVHIQDQDELRRLREMAGIKKKAVDEEKTEEGNLFTKGLADDDVQVGEKIPGTNAIKKKDIDEGILAATANLWKEYKGQYGV